MAVDEIAVLGLGMHPWGKWGRSFVEYGTAAACATLADAGVAWTDIGLVAGGNTRYSGYPGLVAGSTFANALGFHGSQIQSIYAACATGVSALSIARAQILAGVCDLALVDAGETTPKGVPRTR
jgi:acetyl-CoA acetyltransferase